VNMTFIWIAIWIFIILSIVLQVKEGINAKPNKQDLNAKELVSVDPRKYEYWQSLVRNARRQSFNLGRCVFLSIFSIGAGMTVFLYVFIPTSIIAGYVYYRIWRVPNDYIKGVEISEKSYRE